MGFADLLNFWEYITSYLPETLHRGYENPNLVNPKYKFGLMEILGTPKTHDFDAYISHGGIRELVYGKDTDSVTLLDDSFKKVVLETINTVLTDIKTNPSKEVEFQHGENKYTCNAKYSEIPGKGHTVDIIAVVNEKKTHAVVWYKEGLDGKPVEWTHKWHYGINVKYHTDLSKWYMTADLKEVEIEEAETKTAKDDSTGTLSNVRGALSSLVPHYGYDNPHLKDHDIKFGLIETSLLSSGNVEELDDNFKNLAINAIAEMPKSEFFNREFTRNFTYKESVYVCELHTKMTMRNSSENTPAEVLKFFIHNKTKTNKVVWYKVKPDKSIASWTGSYSGIKQYHDDLSKKYWKTLKEV